VGPQVLRLLVLAIAAIFRPKTLLIAENLCLRQQLVVLQRRRELRRSAPLDPGKPMVQRFAASVADCETGNSFWAGSERVGGRTGGGDLLIPLPDHSEFMMYGNDVMDFTILGLCSM
jgi:hypothetical protein